MNKYTNGPWIAMPSIPQEGVECFWILAQPCDGVCRGFTYEVGSVYGPQSEEQAANARLMAAAPMMYEALKQWLAARDAGCCTGTGRAVDAMERAIATADGNSQ